MRMNEILSKLYLGDDSRSEALDESLLIKYEHEQFDLQLMNLRSFLMND